MGNYNKAVDQYIAKAQSFAQPILMHLRELVHEVCPDTEEKMKWSFPHFDYKGEMMCSMASFKQHAAFSFWKAALMKDKSLAEKASAQEAMGHLGKICSLEDLPPDKKLKAWIAEAMKLTDDGMKLPANRKKTVTEQNTPAWFEKALKANPKAWKQYQLFTAGKKKEYIEWLSSAKTDSTREKNLALAVEWISEGKVKNWKYLK
jgi:uncharacterized protein YdeI (YjbR/CyaY-like superfamily)